MAKSIDAYGRTIREILSNKYGIDYYQREYKWMISNIEILLNDLENRFMQYYEEGQPRQAVEGFPGYFLGPIIISHKDNRTYLIDGQQRLTSLTLLLIYLYHLQKERPEEEQVEFRNLIYSEKFGRKSFNLEVEERTDCIEALFQGQSYDYTGKDESIVNLVNRYEDIGELFPDTLREKALPYFIDWLLDKVELVEISTYSDEDAYMTFETMNDRGLKLTMAEMLKGYLIANLDQDKDKKKADELWKDRQMDLLRVSKDDQVDFFKVWLRSQYADTIRERKKNASNRDFEKIGSEFHKWVRDNHNLIGLDNAQDYKNFVFKNFDQYCGYYLLMRHASSTLTSGQEAIYYNALNNFTLQYQMMMASIAPDDDQDTVERKIRMVSSYIDIFVARRIVNFRTLSYSSILYTIFNQIKDIRRKSLSELAALLKQKVDTMEETFDGINSFYLHQQNKRGVHYLLARITNHIEVKSGISSNFVTYVSRSIDKPFEIEHIWADKYERYKNEFNSEEEFARYRNRIGGLLLLPRGFNQSFGDAEYKDKVGPYFAQNLLARTLNPQCYNKNPNFLTYRKQSGLPFKPYPTQFAKADLDERQELYRLICEEIWNTKVFEREGVL